MLFEFLSWPGWRIVTWLPGAVLRWAFTKKWMSTRISADVLARRGSTEIHIYKADGADLTAWFSIRNDSHVPVEIDRIHGGFTYGASICEILDVQRRVIGAHKQEQVYVRTHLHPYQVKRIAANRKNGTGRSEWTIYLAVNSKLHALDLKFHPSDVPVSLSGEQNLEEYEPSSCQSV